jgi:hypothetical protein
VPVAGTTPTGNRPDQFYPDRIHLQVTRGADGPGQAAGREPLTERRAEAVSGIRQHTAEAYTGCHHAIDLRQSDLWLGPRRAVLDWNARTLQPHWIARPPIARSAVMRHDLIAAYSFSSSSPPNLLRILSPPVQ